MARKTRPTDRLPSFGSVTAAHNFIVVSFFHNRIVADRGRSWLKPFVACAPSTARANGWKVVA